MGSGAAGGMDGMGGAGGADAMGGAVGRTRWTRRAGQVACLVGP